MTTRFTLGYEDDFLRWIRDNPNRKNYVVRIGFGEKDNLQDVCDLLNQLNNENERLKQQLRIFSDGLKAEIRETKEVFEDYSECLDEKLELKRENEQLRKDQQRLYNDNIRVKQLITEAHSNERTAIGRSVLLQIIEQI